MDYAKIVRKARLNWKPTFPESLMDAGPADLADVADTDGLVGRVPPGEAGPPDTVADRSPKAAPRRGKEEALKALAADLAKIDPNIVYSGGKLVYRRPLRKPTEIERPETHYFIGR